jgi:hypothetical protein
MKARNVLIIIVVNYLILLAVSAVLELNSLSSKAENLQTTMKTAADLALEQSQLIDDYMAYGGRESYNLMMPSADGSGFVRHDLFSGIYNLDSTVETNREPIFNKLFNNNDLKMLATRTGSMRKPARYYDETRTSMQWYYIPRAAMMGLDFLPPTESINGVKNASGNYMPESFSREMLSAYGLDNHIKESAGQEYYNTPISLGITYLNEDLLGSLFMNNVDLLMRQKYGANLRTEAGGNGVLKGSTYAEKVTGNLSAQNPINNGNFTVLRGQRNDGSSEVETYTGVKPLIVYKVIDMYDSANDNMLVDLFGARKEGYSSKAEYLRNLDSDVLDPATNRPYEKKPIVVAKVTFYLDVIVPYFTAVIRELQGSLGNGSANYIEVKPETATGVDGTRRVAYTRYFAVTP